MTELSIQEFSEFSYLGREQLVLKDGSFINVHFYSEKLVGELFELYGFYVERLRNMIEDKTIKVSPVSLTVVVDVYGKMDVRAEY